MISFSQIDLIIVIVFFAIVLLIGFLPSLRQRNDSEAFLLSGRKVGLFLFVLTTVATWYGGILGVGEFTYRYGLVSWFTQGFPYYLFAFLFAIFFAKKIRASSLFTIPDKIQLIYGRKVSILSSIIIFTLVSPAPYLLMIANLMMMIFDLSLLTALLISFFLSAAYLFKGGYKSDLMTDAFEFFVMFFGFIILFAFSYSELGGFSFLSENLPESHLTFTGNTSITFIIVWFLIALWTFADPGFHQRCYAAKSGNVAKYGIIISIFFWALFDFLTTSTGLFARASLTEIENPVITFPLLAEQILPSGYKGIFYAALFATILSTLNSFLFLSATTFSKDIVGKIRIGMTDSSIIKYTRIGLIIAGLLSIILSLSIDSVIEIWYTIGSICIPSIIILVISSYYEKLKIDKRIAFFGSVFALITGLLWFIIRDAGLIIGVWNEIEPMIIGMSAALIIHLIGLFKKKQ
jgi:SSS family solute:Na+ symporter